MMTPLLTLPEAGFPTFNDFDTEEQLELVDNSKVVPDSKTLL